MPKKNQSEKQSESGRVELCIFLFIMFYREINSLHDFKHSLIEIIHRSYWF